MRNVYYLFSLLFFSTLNCFSQGVDVIFWIDNSDSMNSKDSPTSPNREYEDLYISVQNLMTSVLSCNPNNRVAVVQFSYRNYGVNGTIQERPRIYIEGTGQFQNTPVTFQRRFNVDAGYSYACLQTLQNVLSGIPNPSNPQRVYGSQNLSRTPGNELVVCMISDGGDIGDDIIPNNSSGNNAYSSYTNFKNTFDAKFVMIQGPSADINYHNGLSNNVKAMSAAITSRIGSYNGPVDPYSQDPSGSGVSQRKLLLVDNDPDIPTYYDNQTFYNDANFLLNQSQISIVTEDICNTSDVICPNNITLVSPSNDVTGNDTRQAINTITAYNIVNSNAVATYHAQNGVVLKPGFHGESGSRFRGYIEGCSGNFAGLMAFDENVDENNKERVFVNNDDIQENKGQESSINEKTLHLHPNPTNNNVMVYSKSNMLSITVNSMQNEILFTRDLKDKPKSFELDVSSYQKGIYIINVINEDGTVQTEKLMKN